MSTDDTADTAILCKSCRKALLAWADEISPLDRRLAMYAAMCEAAADSELGGETVAALGAALQDYRERRTVIDYAFMGDEVVTLAVVGLDADSPVVQAELLRLTARRPRRRRLA